MKTQQQYKNNRELNEYLFESFLPYREALNLERGLHSLIRIQKLLLKGKNIEEQILERSSFNIRYLLPKVKPATMTTEEFEKALAKEEKEKSMDEEELRQKLEDEGEELRRRIDSGELDIWDDSPNFIPAYKAKGYLKDTLGALKAKIIDHCQPNKSFLEKMAIECYQALNQDNYEFYPQLQALLEIWDYGKIAYEKEPPYKIVFSDQVAEVLGIDPIMESIKLQELRPLTKKEKSQLRKLMAVFKKAIDLNINGGIQIKGQKPSLTWITKEELNAIYLTAQRKESNKEWNKFKEDI
jgi:hypothetical protein